MLMPQEIGLVLTLMYVTVVAAVLGDANKVKFTTLSAKERFTALTSGEIDIYQETQLDLEMLISDLLS